MVVEGAVKDISGPPKRRPGDIRAERRTDTVKAPGVRSMKTSTAWDY